MPEVTLMSPGRNTYLASMSGRLALILGDYSRKPFSLDPQHLRVVRHFEEYLNRVVKGQEYGRTWRNGLAFDGSTLEALDALSEVNLVAEDVDVTLADLRDILAKLTDHKPIPPAKLQTYRDLLIRLAKAAAAPTYHPESSARL